LKQVLSSFPAIYTFIKANWYKFPVFEKLFFLFALPLYTIIVTIASKQSGNMKKTTLWGGLFLISTTYYMRKALTIFYVTNISPAARHSLAEAMSGDRLTIPM